MSLSLYVLEGKATKVVFVLNTNQEGHSRLRFLIRLGHASLGGGVYGD